MAIILIKNHFPENDVPKVVQETLEAIGSENDLSKRSLPEIERHIKKGELFCLYENDRLAGFVISSKLGWKSAEIHGLYVKPGARGKKYADRLMEVAASGKGITYVAVTYSAVMGKKLTHLGFTLTPFPKLAFRVRAGILMSRAKIHRIAEIFRHLGENKKMSFFVK